MNILFIHQNFPGQYKHLAPLMAQRGHKAVALTPRVREPTLWNGVRVIPYKIGRGSSRDVHPWVQDIETKVIRGEACHDAAMALKARGFTPDVILAHPGWGESLFLKDVWPEARLGLYCELYHLPDYPFTGFDPEFPGPDSAKQALRLRVRNLNNLLHFDAGDAGISPTLFQADTFPAPMRQRISVIHDGVDTDLAQPDAAATLTIGDDLTLTRDDEVITFINRNLEPYRGYHVFMRALPELLRRRPDAQVLIVGGDEVSYGARAPQGTTWKQIYVDEVRGAIPDADWARVHFLGRIPYDRYLKLIQVSRVHVYLTYPFVLSWSLLESMAAGCAVVASDTAPVQEVMTHDQTGRLVDFFDRDALLAEVCGLLDDAGARARLGAAARAHVRETFDLKRHCLPQLEAWVNDLAAMAPRKRLY